jgi:hypothetical protein
MKQETSEKFIQTTNDFVNVLESFDEQQFNERPFEKSWSAAQVGDHIFLSVKRLPLLFAGAATGEKRDHAAKIEMLRSVFLNFETKIDAPAFIIPSEEPYDKTELIRSLKESFTAIAEAIQQYDLTEEMAGSEFPRAGFLTRYEWIWFVIFHTERHTRQLREIKKLVVA